MTLEQRVTDAAGVVRGMGYRTLDDLSHADQFRLADRLGVHVTDLHRRSASHHSVAAAQAELAELKRGPRRSTPAAATARRSTSPDEEAWEHEWFAKHPALLRAVDYVSERVGLRLPASAGPGWRLCAVIGRVGELGDTQRRDKYVSMLDAPLSAAVREHQQLEDAHRSLARQAAAVLAATKRGYE